MITVLEAYLWAILIVVALIALGVFFIRRAARLNRNPSRPYLPPKERFRRALIDMRLKGIATPEELSAETEASEELAAPPPEIPGFPQTPEDAREQADPNEKPPDTQPAGHRTGRRPRSEG